MWRDASFGKLELTGVERPDRMTRATALTALEETALLERAKSFAHEENIKVRKLMQRSNCFK